MKNSDRIIMIIGCAILFLLAVFPPTQKLYANPPQDVKISCDSGLQILTVTITTNRQPRAFITLNI